MSNYIYYLETQLCTSKLSLYIAYIRECFSSVLITTCNYYQVINKVHHFYTVSSRFFWKSTCMESSFGRNHMARCSMEVEETLPRSWYSTPCYTGRWTGSWNSAGIYLPDSISSLQSIANYQIHCIAKLSWVGSYRFEVDLPAICPPRLLEGVN